MKRISLVIPEIPSSKDEFLDLGSKINDYLSNNQWDEVNAAINVIEKSKFYKDETLMQELFRKINIPRKYLKIVENVKPGCQSILHLIFFFSQFWDRDQFNVYFVDSGGYLSLQKHFASKLGSGDEQLFTLAILTNFVTARIDEPKCVKYVMPVVMQFKEMVLNDELHFGVIKEGVNLIHAIASVDDLSGQFMSEIFKTDVSSYAIKVISVGNRPDSSYLNEMQIYSFWNCHCWVISSALAEKSVSFNMKDLPILTQKLCKIMEKTIVYLNDHSQTMNDTLRAVVEGLFQLVNRAFEEKNIGAMISYGIIDGVIKIIQKAHSDKEPTIENHNFRLKCYMIIASQLEVERNFRAIAPILRPIESSLAEKSTSLDFISEARLAVSHICDIALRKGSEQDIAYLVSKGLLPLISRVTNDFGDADYLLHLAYRLYRIILIVPETDDFLHFEKHADAFFNRFKSSNVSSDDKLLYGYVITAISISTLKANTDRIKLLNDHFQQHFLTIKRGTTSVDLIDPTSFILRKMIKVNHFKVTILSHIWYLANKHCEEEYSVKNLYLSLPDTDSCTKVPTKEEMKEQVLKHVLEEVKPILDRHTEYSKADLIKLTNFLALIPCQEQCDIVLYQLEDLVSYCLDLIEDQTNKKIVTNVKKFIKNLHYS